MPIYMYKSLNTLGQTVTGTIEASSPSNASAILFARGLPPINEPREVGAKRAGEIVLFERGIGTKDLAATFAQLETMLDANIPIQRGLAVIQQESKHSAMKRMLKQVIDDLNSGTKVHVAMSRVPALKPYGCLVATGEETGNLLAVLQRLSEFLEKEGDLADKIKSALIYPIVVMLAGLGVAYYLLTNVVPTFASLLTSNGGELPLITKIMMQVSDFLQHRSPILLAILFVAGFFLRRYYQTPGGQYAIDHLFLRIPVLKDLITNRTLSQLMGTIQLMVDSKMTLTAGLELAQRSVSNAVYRKAIESSREMLINNASKFSDSLRAQNTEGLELFPGVLLEMVAVGENSGKLSKLLTKAIRRFDKDLANIVERIPKVIEPVAIILIGGLVGLIAAAMMMPMFAAINQMSK